MGGGTLDVSIVRVEKDKHEVQAISGDSHLGGEDFNNRLTAYLLQKFKDKERLDSSADPHAMARLRKKAEQVKKQLSHFLQVLVKIDSFFQGKDLVETITRALFEELNADLFQRALKPLQDVFESAQLSKSQIDEVVLVGGSTRVPKVQQLVKDFFGGKEPSMGVNPDEAVALGAALHAAALTGRSNCPVVKDVTPLSLGIELVGGRMSVIIKRNTQIPAEATDF